MLVLTVSFRPNHQAIGVANVVTMTIDNVEVHTDNHKALLPGDDRKASLTDAGGVPTTSTTTGTIKSSNINPIIARFTTDSTGRLTAASWPSETVIDKDLLSVFA